MSFSTTMETLGKEKRMPAAPFYGFTPQNGIHVLKDSWTQKRYLGQQSAYLSENLEDAISVAFDAAPQREDNFRLGRELTPVENMAETSEERRLESAMMSRWSNDEMWTIPKAWRRLVAFQVPLRANQHGGGFGEIDLLGVNQTGVPVVVELKKSPKADADGRTQSTETPLRMVLEAATYALVLRKNWKNFREAWVNRLREIEMPDDIIQRVPPNLETVPLVAVAPASFWLEWLPFTEKGTNQLSPETWASFALLLKRLEEMNLPVSFLSISGHYHDINSLAVQPLINFPPV